MPGISPTHSNKRRLLVALVAALAVSPALALAQTRLPVVGLLWIETRPPSPHLAPLVQGLREQGYVPGRNIRLEDRYMVGGYEDLAQAARNLVARDPDVILTYGSSAVQALQRATSTIPVVIAGSGDPVKLGVARSLSRPQTNFTGLTILAADLSGKRLELLKDAFPNIRRLAVPFYPRSASEAASVASLEAAARQKQVEVRRVEIREIADLRSLADSIRKTEADAIVFIPGTLFRANAAELAAQAAKTRLPAIFGDEQYVEAGGLIGYGPNIAEHFRKSAQYIDKILKGARPGELAIEQPTRFYLSVNLRAARAQKIDLPRALLQRADRIID